MERVSEEFEVPVRIDNFLRAREADSVDQARVVERVGKNGVTGLQKATEETDVGGVTRTKIERSFGAGKVREFRFDILPFARIAGKQPGTRGGDRLGARDRFQHRLLETWIVRKPEVVVRAHCREFQAPCIAFIPRFSRSCWSASGGGFGVVRSFSPVKMEFAPARKQSVTASDDISRRPAASRTREAGIRTRAVAMARTMTSGSSAFTSASGVPSFRTSMLTGTLSGCGLRRESSCSRPIRSSSVSPMPRIPPQQTVMPALRTCAMVCR